MTLGRLVGKILKLVPELPRLRLSSIDTIEADEPLIRALAEEERLMPHLHLSLQAGDDMILKRMKRRHSRAHAIAFCEEARRLRPDIVFGADIIAGFPTETEAMFANSLRLVEECGLTFLHVFPYSPAARYACRADAAARPTRHKRACRTASPYWPGGSRCLSVLLLRTAASRCSWKKTTSAGRRNSPSCALDEGAASGRLISASVPDMKQGGSREPPLS